MVTAPEGQSKVFSFDRNFHKLSSEEYVSAGENYLNFQIFLFKLMEEKQTFSFLIYINLHDI